MVSVTEGLFRPENSMLAALLRQDEDATPRKLLFVVDSGVAEAHPSLLGDIAAYTALHK